MPSVRTSSRALAPRKRPKQARSRATWDAILEGAAQVFAARGYVDTNTDVIAERAGVSIGSLYQYFPSKDAILVALLERHLAEVAQAFAPLLARLDDDPPLDDVVSEMVSLAFAVHAEAPRLHQVLTEEAPIPAAIRERLLAAEGTAARRLAAYFRRSCALDLADPELAADLVVAMVDTMSHRLTIEPPGKRRAAELACETTTMVLAYLRAGR